MKKFIIVLILSFFIPVVAQAAYGDTTTYVSKIYHGDGGNRLNAFFDFPEDIEVNKNGAFIIADTFNNVIRRIKPGGKVKTVAGTGAYGDKDDLKHKSEFAGPKGVAQKSGVIYVADTGNNKVKKVKDGVVTTIASGLNAPEDVEVNGSTVFILDTGNNALKKVSTSGSGLTTVTSSLNEPKKMAITNNGKYAYVADAGSYKLKKVNLSSGAITTVAGTGKAGSKDGDCDIAKFENIWGVHLFDSETLYVSDGDGFSDTVRKIDLSNGCEVTTFASDTNMVSINFPNGLTTYDGSLYVLATGIGIVQKYDLDDANVNEKFAGKNRFNVKKSNPVLTGNPKFMLLSKNKKRIYFSENNRLRSMPRASKNPKSTKLIAGSVIDNYNSDDTVPMYGDEARFSDIPSFGLSKNGKKIFAVDRNNNRISEVVIKTGKKTYLTGAGETNLTSGESNDYQNGSACPNEFDTGVKGCAYFDRPTGSVMSKNGKYLYVSDSGNNVIRRVTVRGKNKGKVTTLAGSGSVGFTNGTGTDASFNAPIGLAISKSGKILYVADRGNHVIRKINIKTKAVTTYAGTGDNGYLEATTDMAQFSYPEWITRGKDGNLYISSVGSHRIRMIDRSLGVTKLVSGSGERGFANGSADKAKFNNPRGLLALKNKILVAELYTDLIRSIDITGTAPFSEDAPIISEASPNAIAKEWFSDNSAQIEILGSGFRHGATAKVGNFDATVSVRSSSSVVIDMPIADMAAGYYTIRITNSDGQSYDKVRALSVSSGGLVPSTDYMP